VPVANPPYVHVVDEALPPAAVDFAYKSLKSAGTAISPVFVEPSDPAARLAGVLPAPIALLFARYLERIHSEATALGYQPAAILELWTVLARALGPKVFLHIDNDEEVRSSTGEVVTPEFATILYLGPDGDFTGGETLIGHEEPSEEVRSEVLFKKVPAEQVRDAVGPNATVVPPQRGRACIFRGSLPHSIMPFDEHPGGPRITFLANGWVTPPTLQTRFHQEPSGNS
jgi:hypothetical protein